MSKNGARQWTNKHRRIIVDALEKSELTVDEFSQLVDIRSSLLNVWRRFKIPNNNGHYISRSREKKIRRNQIPFSKPEHFLDPRQEAPKKINHDEVFTADPELALMSEIEQIAKMPVNYSLRLKIIKRLLGVAP